MNKHIVVWAMLVFFACLFCNVSMAAGSADLMQTQLRTAIFSEPEVRAVADLMMAEMSSQPAVALLERDLIGVILKEQKLSAAGISDRDSVRVGRLLKADIVILLQLEARPVGTFVRLRVIAVQPGVIIQNISAPWPLVSLQQLPVAVSGDVPRWRARLSGSKPVIISLPKLKSSYRQKGTQVIESALHAILVERLSAESGVFVVERQDAAILVDEVQDNRNVDRPETVVVDGLIEQAPGTNMPVQVKLFVRRHGAEVKAVEAVGSADDLIALADNAARGVMKVMRGSLPVERWDSKKEAKYYADRAIWLRQIFSYEDAETAANAALYLGLDTPELQKLRFEVGMEVFNRTAPASIFGAHVDLPTNTVPRQWLERFYAYLLEVEAGLKQSSGGQLGADYASVDKASHARTGDYYTNTIMEIGEVSMRSLNSAIEDNNKLSVDDREVWERVFRQYQLVRKLREADSPNIILDRVSQAYLWCKKPEEYADLFYKAFTICQKPAAPIKVSESTLVGEYLRKNPTDPLCLGVASTIGEYLACNQVDGLDVEVRKRLQAASSEMDRFFWASIDAVVTRKITPSLQATMAQLSSREPSVDAGAAFFDYLRKWEVVLAVTEHADKTEDWFNLADKLGGCLLKSADRIVTIPSGWEHVKFVRSRLNPWSDVCTEMSLLLISKLVDPVVQANDAVSHCRDLSHDASDACTKLYPAILQRINASTNVEGRTTLWLDIMLLRVIHPSLATDAKKESELLRQIVGETTNLKDLAERVSALCCLAKHCQGDFCEAVYPVLKNAADRDSSKDKAMIAHYTQYLKQLHGLPMTNPAPVLPGNNTAVDDVVNVSRVWDITTIAANKGTYERFFAGISCVGSDYLLYCVTFNYGSKENGGIVDAGSKTYVIKIRLDNFAFELISCPWVFDAGYGCNFFTFAIDRYLFVGAGNPGSQNHERFGLYRLALDTGRWDSSLGFNPCIGWRADPLLVAGYVDGKIILPVSLAANGGPSVSAGSNGRACGVMLVDASTLEKELLVSGLRKPPKSPLDIPSVNYFVRSVKSNGDVLIQTHKNLSSVYNLKNATWRNPAQEELACADGKQVNPINLAFPPVSPSVISLPDAKSMEFIPADEHGGAKLLIRRKNGMKRIIPLRMKPEPAGGTLTVLRHGVLIVNQGDVYFIPSRDITNYLLNSR